MSLHLGQSFEGVGYLNSRLHYESLSHSVTHLKYVGNILVYIFEASHACFAVQELFSSNIRRGTFA